MVVLAPGVLAARLCCASWAMTGDSAAPGWPMGAGRSIRNSSCRQAHVVGMTSSMVQGFHVFPQQCQAARCKCPNTLSYRPSLHALSCKVVVAGTSACKLCICMYRLLGPQDLKRFEIFADFAPVIRLVRPTQGWKLILSIWPQNAKPHNIEQRHSGDTLSTPQAGCVTQSYVSGKPDAGGSACQLF